MIPWSKPMGASATRCWNSRQWFYHHALLHWEGLNLPKHKVTILPVWNKQWLIWVKVEIEYRLTGQKIIISSFFTTQLRLLLTLLPRMQLKGSVKEPNISIYFFFPPIIQSCPVSDVLFTGGRGVSDFGVLKYYQLNINYSVNILNECLCILIDCS